MKIEIKEIQKIELKENEFLWITVEDSFPSEMSTLMEILEEVVPESLIDKIIVGCERIKLTKIKKG